MPQQFRDILAPLAQRRDFDADYVQPVQQVFAKVRRLDARLQVLMSGGDDAHVDLDGRLTAHSIELAFRQHAQQPRLQGRRHVADFVEEQRAAVGLLEASAAQSVGAGEGTLLVAEQLRLQKIRGKGRRVEGDEGFVGARTVAVQSACHELLACARFPGDQHCHAGAGQPADRAEHLLHRCRLAEQFRDAAPCGFGVDGHGGLLRGAAHQVDRLVDVEGLGQVLECAALIGGHRRVQIGMCGHHDDGQPGPRHLNFLEQLETAASRHSDVGHQYVGCVGAQRCQDIVGLVEALRSHAAALQRLLEHPPDRSVVVDQPDLQRLGVHAESMGREITNMVLPGALSNSIRPPWRLTRSWAIPSPKPVPSAWPDTNG